jgi:peptide/nickel transport system substrate-binding protein
MPAPTEGPHDVSGWKRNALLLAAALTLAGCSAPGRAPQERTPAGSTAPTGPRGTLRIAWATEPENLHSKLAAGSGLNEFFWVFNSFLTYYDFAGAAHPMLARDIPRQENGDWVVNPDGTMVTTYRLRVSRWHDGTPLTAQDYVFGYEVYIDPDMPIRDRVPETLMSNVEAPDDLTLVIRWKQPYIGANLLTFQQLPPLARHIAEQKYRTQKANLVFSDDWTTEFVGSGPFRLERWVPGSLMVARAYNDWVLGPPKLDTVEIRFMSDTRAELANVLAGEVDIVNSPGVRTPEAVIARDQWAGRPEGYIRAWSRQPRFLAFQFREVPNWQRAVTDLRVRQALMHATDREGLAEILSSGLGKATEAFIVPNDPLASEVDRVVTHYPYDPGRALALLNEVGWRRPDASSPLTNATGQTLDLEIWTTPDGGGEQEASILVDNWKSVGINVTIYLIPAARQRDLEHRVSFPAVNPTARSATLDNFVFTSAHVPTAEARWQGANRGSFRDGEVDRLYNLALTTLGEQERAQHIVALHKRMSETLGVGMLFFNAEVLIARNRVRGPVGEVAEKSGMSWNIFEWEVTD